MCLISNQLELSDINAENALICMLKYVDHICWYYGIRLVL